MKFKCYMYIQQDRDIGDKADVPPIAFQLSAEYKGATLKKLGVIIYEINGNGPVKSPTSNGMYFKKKLIIFEDIHVNIIGL